MQKKENSLSSDEVGIQKSHPEIFPSTVALPRWQHRGYLPHCNAPGKVQHVVISLVDALPRQTRWQIQDDLEPKFEVRKPRLHNLLDQGKGSCLLRDPQAAACVQESLLYGHPERYTLYAWVIMPNHIHVLFRQNAQWTLGKVVGGWKRHTTKFLKTLPGADCYRSKDGSYQIWQREYWDRYIRNALEFQSVKRYIEANPVKAKLVERPTQWHWSSAFEGKERE